MIRPIILGDANPLDLISLGPASILLASIYNLPILEYFYEYVKGPLIGATFIFGPLDDPKLNSVVSNANFFGVKLKFNYLSLLSYSFVCNPKFLDGRGDLIL
jgi:hypothetical protein